MTTTNLNDLNVCSDPGYLNLISIKNRFRLKNIPPQRFDNLQNSPYDINNNLKKAFTQEELNMRRKAEILNYSANKTNTKTNNFTKKEKWAQLVNGSSQQRNLPYSYIKNNLVLGTTNYVQTCPSGTILYTPTYASGVPGKIMNLYEDPNIPLYMYSTSRDSYGLINQEVTTQQLEYDMFDNIYLYDNNPNKNNGIVASIYILNIDTKIYTFNIQFPISIFISATAKSGYSGTFNENITISFIEKPLHPYIYYGKDVVETISTTNILPQKSVTFNVSMKSITGSFSGNQYIGNYALSNLTLNTEPTYLYDLNFGLNDENNNSLINIDTQKNTNLYNYFENISYGIIMNPSLNNINVYNNCTVVNPGIFPQKNTYQTISIT
jgi:hypothetical protein